MLTRGLQAVSRLYVLGIIHYGLPSPGCPGPPQSSKVLSLARPRGKLLRFDIFTLETLTWKKAKPSFKAFLKPAFILLAVGEADIFYHHSQ
jgi:hypothetical protein